MKLHGAKLFFLFTFISFCQSAFAADGHEIPKYTALVNDFAKVLSAEELQILDAKLKKYEDSTSTQIFVVIEANMPIADAYTRAMEFARGWGVGSKENNNGVLLYLAINDRKYFTVTSQATQGKLTDGIVGQIERDYLVPNFKNKNYFEGVNQTTNAFMLALSGEFKKLGKKNKIPGWISFAILFGIIFLLGLFNNRNNGRGMRGSGAYWIPGVLGGLGGGGFGSSGGGGGWGGAGGGGGFDGGGAGGSW